MDGVAAFTLHPYHFTVPPKLLITSSPVARALALQSESIGQQHQLQMLNRLHEDRIADAGTDWAAIEAIDADLLASFDAIAADFTADLRASNYERSLEQLF
jgi:hypothetical protein